VAGCCEYATESLDSIKDVEEHIFGYTARFCSLELVIKLINIFFWSTKERKELLLNTTRCKSL
jgi:CRISPR/Cas system CMR-associated protein Cmr1 (group 7 of RAMP superfamily)